MFVKRQARKNSKKPAEIMKYKSSCKTLPAAIAILCGAVLPSQAETFHVAAGDSIQAALDEAAVLPGADIVLLGPGTHFGQLEIEDEDPLTLRGAGDAVIDAGDDDEDVIKVEGGDVTIQNVGITGGDDGIDAEGMAGAGDSLTLIGVEVWGNADRGIEADDIDHVTIKNADVWDNQGDGIKIEVAVSALIVNVDSSGNDDGMDIEEAESVSLRNVVVSENGDEGLEVDNVGSVEVTQATAWRNDDEGFDIDDTESILLRSVEAIGNGENGFQAESEDVTIQQITVIGSRFAENGEDGVQVREEGGGVVEAVLLQGVVARDNVESGLDIDVSGAVTLRGVRYGLSEGNGEVDMF